MGPYVAWGINGATHDVGGVDGAARGVGGVDEDARVASGVDEDSCGIGGVSGPARGTGGSGRGRDSGAMGGAVKGDMDVGSVKVGRGRGTSTQSASRRESRSGVGRCTPGFGR
jgi:hypothetical protein